MLKAQWPPCKRPSLATNITRIMNATSANMPTFFKAIKPSSRYEDISRQRFGRLTVLSVEGRNGRKAIVWKCICECGNVHFATTWSLKGGSVSSCGCYKIERNLVAKRVHGHASRQGTTEYRSWQSLKSRCCNPSSPYFSDYGGRGITVCDQWKDSFLTFLADMGRKPTPKHTIERKNNDGNYEPGNCKWATVVEQANNRRSSKFIVVGGVRMTISQCSRQYGIKMKTLWDRLQAGWDANEAATRMVYRAS